MCVIIYHICDNCHLGYPGHTLYCEDFRPPSRFCPAGTRYDFAIVQPEQCFLHPEHMQAETTGYYHVNIHNENGQVVGQRPCERFVPAGAIADYLASQEQQEQPRTLQRSASMYRLQLQSELQYAGRPQISRPFESRVQDMGATGSGYAVAAPRPSFTQPTVAGPSRSRTPDQTMTSRPQTASPENVASSSIPPHLRGRATSVEAAPHEPSFTPSSPIPEAEAEDESPAEFAEQHQRIEEAILTYRSSHKSIPGRGRAMERTDTVNSSASDSASVSRSSSHRAAPGKRRSSSVPAQEVAETTEFAQEAPTAAAPISTSTLDPSLPPFYPKNRPGTPSSWAGLATQYKGKGKEVAKPASSHSDVGSRAPTPPSTPAKTKAEAAATSTKKKEKEKPAAVGTPANKPAPEQEQQGSAVAPMTQSTIPSSPALSSSATTNSATVASAGTRSPSVRRLALTEAGEFPSLQTIAQPRMSSSDRPAVRSWASVASPRKQQQKPLSALTPTPARSSGKKQKLQSPATAEDKKEGAAPVTNKPTRSYSAALASGSNTKAPAKPFAKQTEDWPAPPPSWGKK